MQIRYVLYVFLSALTGAGGVILTEILLRFWTVPALHIAIPASLIGGCFLLLGAALQRTCGWIDWPATDWLRLLAAAGATFGLGFLLLYEAIDLIGASKTLLLSRLEVIFIVSLAVVFLGETWTRRHWFACVLALCGTVLVTFDPDALDLRFALGEMIAVLAALVFAVGIILLKSLVDHRDGQLVTGYGLLLGAIMLLPFALYEGLSLQILADLSGWGLLALLFRGLFLGISWVTYNIAMKHLGASHCTVLFLSVVVFTVVLQVSIDGAFPELGLRVPANLFASLVGGGIICVAVILLQRQE